jgi:hypothetical protein
MYAAQATQKLLPLRQNLELCLATVLQMNWHFINIAMIMSIYRIEQSGSLTKRGWNLIMRLKKHLQKMTS